MYPELWHVNNVRCEDFCHQYHHQIEWRKSVCKQKKNRKLWRVQGKHLSNMEWGCRSSFEFRDNTKHKLRVDQFIKKSCHKTVAAAVSHNFNRIINMQNSRELFHRLPVVAFLQLITLRDLYKIQLTTTVHRERKRLTKEMRKVSSICWSDISKENSICIIFGIYLAIRVKTSIASRHLVTADVTCAQDRETSLTSSIDERQVFHIIWRSARGCWP